MQTLEEIELSIINANTEEGEWPICYHHILLVCPIMKFVLGLGGTLSCKSISISNYWSIHCHILALTQWFHHLHTKNLSSNVV